MHSPLEALDDRRSPPSLEKGPGPRLLPLFRCHAGTGRSASSLPTSSNCWTPPSSSLPLSLFHQQILSTQSRVNNGPHSPPPRPLPIRAHSLALRRTRPRLPTQSLRPLPPARTTGAQEIASIGHSAHNHGWRCHACRVRGRHGVHSREIWQGEIGSGARGEELCRLSVLVALCKWHAAAFFDQDFFYAYGAGA